MSETKNDIAWKLIFDKYNIFNYINCDGFFIISSSKINEFREARLMTKFDHKSQLPSLFRENKLSILPVSRGNYIIGSFDTFYNFNSDDSPVYKIKYPSHLKSLDYRDITSEATAINCAYVSKILHDFSGEENLFPTVSGRMSSSSFNFKINSSSGLFNVQVENAQIEIDGGYEGESSLYLIEAKNYISDDFVIRQLYYPFKLWYNRIEKEVRPVFLTYSNGLFHLREYTFNHEFHYNSIQLVKHKKYTFHEGIVNKKSITKLLNSVDIVLEPEIPFPQADSFERIINLGEQLFNIDFLTKEEITLNFDFDSRQTDYYINAGRYLGLIEIQKKNGQTGCKLSLVGKHTFGLPILERQLIFIQFILMHSVFNKAFMLFWNSGKVPGKKSIIQIMKQVKPFHISSEKTFDRRASTIKGWISWIIDQIEE